MNATGIWGWVLLVILSLTNNAFAVTPPVDWASAEGSRRFARAADKVDFFSLANQFEAQTNKVFAGPATAAMVLNALRLYRSEFKIPFDSQTIRDADVVYYPKGSEPRIARYTAHNFFNFETDGIKTRSEVFGKPRTGPEPGLVLRQLHEMLLRHKLQSEIRIMNSPKDEKIAHAELVGNLKLKDDYVIVNFLRPALGQTGDGHYSALAAYDAASDSFLILDVDPSVGPWSWVKAEDLFRAMQTKDGLENRGYLLVREGH